MRWLLGCMKSGELRELLRAHGHVAYTCDLEPAEDGSPYHLRCDVREILQWDCAGRWNGSWDRAIFMPECRFLSSSGQHRTGKPNQRTQADVEAAVEFFMQCIEAPIEKIAVENSIGIMSTRYRRPDQIVHPWMFGDDASKSTCWWLKGFQPLLPTEFVEPRWVDGRPRWANQTDSGQNRLAPSPTGSADRARTYSGMSKAIAKWWA